MLTKTVWASCATIALTSFVCTHSFAHFVWLRIDHTGDDKAVHLFFSEGGHVDGDRIPENVQSAEAVLHAVGQDAVALPLTDFDHEGFVSKTATLSQDDSFAISTHCQYGLYHGSLLQYYAKAIHVSDTSKLNEINATPDAQLDLIPSVIAGKLVIGVAWQRQPLEGATIQIVDPDGNDHELRTDAQGSAELAGLSEGLYVLRTNRTDKSASGTVNGEAYKSANYYSTLTIRIPANLAGGDSNQVSALQIDSAYPLLPIGVSSFGAAVNGDWLYVYSGHTGRAHAHSRDNLSPHFCRINLNGDHSWEPLPMQRPLQGLAMVAHGDYVYRIGGLDALNAADEDEELRSVADFARFHVEDRTWETLPDLPQPRSSHDAVVVDDRLYVMGGWTLKPDGDEEWLYHGLVIDLAADELMWQEFEVPFERRALAAGTHEGLVYALGGLTSLGEIDRTVSVYDPATGECSEGPELPGTGMDGFGVSAWQVGGRLFVSGVSGTILELDAEAKRWNEVGQLQQGRFFHRLLPSHDGSLLAVAGASMQGHLTNIERIELE